MEEAEKLLDLPDDRVGNNGKPLYTYWLITYNNPPDDWRTYFKALGADYGIGQLEVGENGTPHIQGLLYWKKGVRGTFFKSKRIWSKGIPVTHVEKVTKYCTKTETRKDGPFTFGLQPKGIRKIRDFDAAMSLVKKGEVLKVDADILIPYYQSLCRLALQFVKPVVPDDLRGHWWHGKPNTGKSRTAFELYPGAYRKGQNKWWDGYLPTEVAHEVVILDDLDKKGECLSHYLKIWTDRYPAFGEVKGSTVPLNFRMFIITSNYVPEDIWGDDVALCEAIRRRCNFRQFGSEFDIILDKFIKYN